MDVISLIASVLLWVPPLPTITLSAERYVLKGLASLFFHASHSFISFADNCLRSCALLIFGLGLGVGEGDAVACGCAKHKEANAINSSAARGRHFFIGVLLVIENSLSNVANKSLGGNARTFYYFAERSVNDGRK